MPESRRRRDRFVPPALMLASVAAYALLILFASLSHAAANPLRFRALLSAAAAPCYLYASRQRGITTPGFWRQFGQRLIRPPTNWMTAATLASNLDYAILAFASRYIPISAVVTIYDLWPIAVILLLCAAARRVPPAATLWAMPAALAGICLVGFAAAPEGIRWLPQDRIHMAIGLTTAVVTPLVSSLAALAFPAGAALSDLWPEDTAPNAASKATMLLYGLCDLVAAPALYAAGSDTPIRWPYALLAGAAYCWRQANARARHPGVNAVAYLSPLATLGLLSVTGRAGSVRWLPLTTGAGLMVAANCASLMPDPRTTAVG